MKSMRFLLCFLPHLLLIIGSISAADPLGNDATVRTLSSQRLLFIGHRPLKRAPSVLRSDSYALVFHCFQQLRCLHHRNNPSSHTFAIPESGRGAHSLSKLSKLKPHTKQTQMRPCLKLGTLSHQVLQVQFPRFSQHTKKTTPPHTLIHNSSDLPAMMSVTPNPIQSKIHSDPLLHSGLTDLNRVIGRLQTATARQHSVADS